MTSDPPVPLVVNGWAIFAHPVFLGRLEALTRQVEALRENDPGGCLRKNAARRLAAIARLAFEAIPQAPSHARYREGRLPGEEHMHWFSAWFFRRYRLHFRFHEASKVIVLAWVSDEGLKRP